MAMEAISNLGVYQAVQPVVQPAAVQQQVKQEGDQIDQQASEQAQAPAKDLTIAPVVESQSEDGEQHLTEEQQQAQNERIREAVAKFNKKINANEEAVFGIHEGTNRVTIKMVDKETKKVVKEFPPDKTLDMIAKVWELAGIMVDERR